MTKKKTVSKKKKPIKNNKAGFFLNGGDTISFEYIGSGNKMMDVFEKDLKLGRCFYLGEFPEILWVAYNGVQLSSTNLIIPTQRVNMYSFGLNHLKIK